MNAKLKVYSQQRGIGIIAALLVIVLLGGLALSITQFTQIATRNQSADLMGSRALLAAKAGVEWQSWLILAAENSNLNTPTATYTCPSSAISQKFDGFLIDFMVTVRCIKTIATENNQSISVYQIESVACNLPSAGACPNNAAVNGMYIERAVSALISVCRQTPDGAVCA